MAARKTLTALAGSALLLTGGLTVLGHGATPIIRAASATPKPAASPVRPNLMGSITAASGSTLKVKTMPARVTATVFLTAKTTYLVNGKTVKTRPIWKKGEQIAVVGTKAKDGSYTAKSIMVGAPAGGPGGAPSGAPSGPGGPGGPGGTPPVTGKVVSSSSTSLVVKTSSGKTTYKLTSSTHYAVNGKNVTKRPTFKAGETVNVMATKSGSSYTAQAVFVGKMPAPPSGGPPPAGSNG